ncbi:MAG: ShlB/FhaC/HecB family hemolysin secretion/activation protein [Nitrospira sp.]|nr:ShlB/FhaC/HecB family hemolysin secretion/activation protein [Nitrospira sp.]
MNGRFTGVLHVCAWIMGRACMSLILIGLPSVGWAQTVPDSGTLQQQQQQQLEQDRREQLPTQAPEVEPPQREERSQSPQPAVPVKGFRFQGNTLVDDETLQTVVAPFTNRSLTLQEMQQAASAVAAWYRRDGWVVRTYLPRQDVTEGIITINILEATFGEATFNEPLPKRIPGETILDIITRQQQTGAHLNLPALDRGLLLADDLPGVAVNGGLQVGKQAGETNLLVTAADEDLFRVAVGVDNAGTRATGATRGWARATANSPLNIGDQVTINTILSEGSQYGRLHYSVPVGRDGWRIGASTSYLHYELVEKTFDPLNAKGEGWTVGLDAVYPLIRARNYNLQFLLNYDYRQFENRSLGTRQSDYHIVEGTAGLAGNWFESLVGTPGATFGSLAWVIGTLDQGKHQASENADREGEFNKFRVFASREQQIIPWMSAYVAFTGQKSFETLDSAEKFYVGGPQSVRAYPVNEASGSTGWLTNLELRTRAANGMYFTGFYDVGHVTNKNSVGKTYTLKGGGLNLGWRMPSGLTLDVIWAHRVGDNPNPTVQRKDQDGSSVENRFWLSASFAF